MKKWKPTTEQQREYDRRYREKHREEYNRRRMNQNRRKWAEVIAILGDKCVICGFQRKQNGKRRRITFHEIHGKSHKENPYYVLKHIEDFVPICHLCHRTLHMFFNHSEQFLKYLKLLRSD